MGTSFLKKGILIKHVEEARERVMEGIIKQLQRVGTLADAVKMVEERDWCVEESGESYVVAWTIGCSLFMATPPPLTISFHITACSAAIT